MLFATACDNTVSNESSDSSPSVQITELPVAYTASKVATVTANGNDVPLIDFVTDYDYCHFSFSGSVTVSVTVNEDITTHSVSPLAKGIHAEVDGKSLSFTLNESGYFIVKINSIKEIVIAADAAETDVPVIGTKGVYNIVDYGAVANGSELSTQAIQNAINAAEAADGGTVYIPEGTYLTSNIVLKSNVNIYLAHGAVLRGTGNSTDYAEHFNKRNLGLVAPGTWFISGQGVENVKIYGRGTIDARGDYMRNDCSDKFLSDVLFLQQCSNITVDGVILRDGGFWGTLVLRCDNVKFLNTKHFQANAYGNNKNHENDALDIVESQNVLVSHSIAISEDDTYSTKCYVLNGLDINENWMGTTEKIENVVFDDCFGWSRCGTFKIGWGVGSDQTDIVFKNSYSYKSMFAIGIKVNSGVGTKVSGVTFENIDIEGFMPRQGDSSRWLDFTITSGSNPGNINVSDVTVRNIRVRDAGNSQSRLQGSSKSYIFDNITFENIYMPGSDKPVDSLSAMNIISSNYGKVTVIPQKSETDTSEPENLALNKTGWSKYVDSRGKEEIAYKALDGEVSNDSRWGTSTSYGMVKATGETFATTAEWEAVRPTQYLVVDLEAKTEFDRIVINWEAGYAKEYKLLISDTAEDDDWTEIAHVTDGRAGVIETNLSSPVSARYIKMQGIKEGSRYGYSIYEFEVYNISGTQS